MVKRTAEPNEDRYIWSSQPHYDGRHEHPGVPPQATGRGQQVATYVPSAPRVVAIGPSVKAPRVTAKSILAMGMPGTAVRDPIALIEGGGGGGEGYNLKFIKK